ncbi:MAG TPA: hypothetical protein VEH55_08210 [Gaiellaceae bacterium]|jgi:hypothetical protein|nr:hypothetical protein [Gaiellaceae bacterium]
MRLLTLLSAAALAGASHPVPAAVEHQIAALRHPSGRWVRLVASSQVPPTKLADVGLGTVVASGRLVR